jgi:hypothetical protein
VPIKPNRRLGFIGTAAPTPAGPKVFWFFFAKKNLFLAFQLSGPLLDCLAALAMTVGLKAYLTARPYSAIRQRRN